MESRKGFTLVELMVVILIVGILAAVAIPIMRGRIDSAKWSEGRSMMGTVASSIRAYVAEKDTWASGLNGGFANWGVQLGFRDEDFDGTYFDNTMFDVQAAYDPNGAPALTFTIKGTNDKLQPTEYTLTEAGAWAWQ